MRRLKRGAMRVMTLILFSIALSGGGAAVAQAPAARDDADTTPRETPDEVVVRGKRLADFRVEVEAARVRAYDVFNEINSTNDFDIQCVDEPRRGSRMGRRVCVAQFEHRIAAAAARDYLATMRAICPDVEGLTQRCLFDPGLASSGKAAAMGAESEAPTQRDRLQAEIERLARTDLRFGQAILDFYDAN